MNDGSPVSITSQPLISPIMAANRKTRKIAGHIDMPYSVVSRPPRRPEVPIITPELRSNSPAIMSSATGTATMPVGRGDAGPVGEPAEGREAAAGGLVDGDEEQVDDDGAEEGAQLGATQQLGQSRRGDQALVIGNGSMWQPCGPP